MASQIPASGADVVRMVVGRLTQCGFVIAYGLRDAVEGIVEFHRLRIPPMHHVPETRRRGTTPYRRRHTAHTTDECLQRRSDLFISSVDRRSYRAHQIKIGAERVATCGYAHLFPFAHRPRT
jgi:hypothetical protein